MLSSGAVRFYVHICNKVDSKFPTVQTRQMVLALREFKYPEGRARFEKQIFSLEYSFSQQLFLEPLVADTVLHPGDMKGNQMESLPWQHSLEDTLEETENKQAKNKK